MGTRGEGWVLGQFVIGATILAAGWVTHTQVPLIVQVFGAALMLAGGSLIGLGILSLGRNLTPFPKPRTEEHTLVTTGVYHIVRHPIYAGFAMGAVGWSLFSGSLLALALSGALFVWFDLKSRREERWLVELHPEYAAYQARVKKLIPFLY